MILPGVGSAPLDPPERSLRHARRPVSSSASDSARKMAPNYPDETFWGGIRGRSRGRAVQVSSA
eukprot:6861713-Alexandrium_andersonii.AAC.1